MNCRRDSGLGDEDVEVIHLQPVVAGYPQHISDVEQLFREEFIFPYLTFMTKPLLVPTSRWNCTATKVSGGCSSQHRSHQRCCRHWKHGIQVFVLKCLMHDLHGNFFTVITLQLKTGHSEITQHAENARLTCRAPPRSQT